MKRIFVLLIFCCVGLNINGQIRKQLDSIHVNCLSRLIVYDAWVKVNKYSDWELENRATHLCIYDITEYSDYIILKTPYYSYSDGSVHSYIDTEGNVQFYTIPSGPIHHDYYMLIPKSEIDLLLNLEDGDTIVYKGLKTTMNIDSQSSLRSLIDTSNWKSEYKIDLTNKYKLDDTHLLTYFYIKRVEDSIRFFSGDNVYYKPLLNIYYEIPFDVFCEFINIDLIPYFSGTQYIRI